MSAEKDKAQDLNENHRGVCKISAKKRYGMSILIYEQTKENRICKLIECEPEMLGFPAPDQKQKERHHGGGSGQDSERMICTISERPRIVQVLKPCIDQARFPNERSAILRSSAVIR